MLPGVAPTPAVRSLAALPSAERRGAVAQGLSSSSEVRPCSALGLEFTPEKDGECSDSEVGGQG